MSTTIVAPSRNGHKPHPGPCPVPLLAAKVDLLRRLRAQLEAARQAEAALAGELLAALVGQGLARLAGVQAVATVAHERILVPLMRLTPAERRACGYTIAELRRVDPEDLANLQESVTRPVLRTAPAPTSTSKGVVA